MQVSNHPIMTNSNNSHIKNKQFEVVKSEVNNKVQDFVQPNLDPMRLHTSDKALQERLNRFPAEKKLNMELLAPKNYKVISNNSKNKKNQPTLIKNEEKKSIQYNGNSEKLELNSKLDSKPRDTEKKLLCIDEESIVSKQISSSKPVVSKTENLEDLEFSELCKMFAIVEKKEVAQNSKQTIREKPRPYIQNQNGKKATNDSFITSTLVVSAKKEKIEKIECVGQDIFSKIRFSQRTVSCKIGSGESLFAFQNRLIDEGFNKIFAIKIVLMPDGTYTSLDNRRLLCVQKIASTFKDFKIFVDKNDHTDPVDINLLKYMRKEFYNFHHYNFFEETYSKENPYGLSHGVSPATWGEVIQTRVILYVKGCRLERRNGYDIQPTIQPETEKRYNSK